MTQQNLPVMSSADQDLMRNWSNTHDKCVRQRTARQETTKYKAGSFPLNMYQRVLMGVPNSQLTAIFSAKYQLTIIFLANSRLTAKLG